MITSINDIFVISRDLCPVFSIFFLFQWHYYQPFWTLVGAGAKTFHQSGRRMETVLPKKANWIKEKVASIDPDNCLVTTNEGREVSFFLAYSIIFCAIYAPAA